MMFKTFNSQRRAQIMDVRREAAGTQEAHRGVDG